MLRAAQLAQGISLPWAMGEGSAPAETAAPSSSGVIHPLAELLLATMGWTLSHPEHRMGLVITNGNSPSFTSILVLFALTGSCVSWAQLEGWHRPWAPLAPPAAYVVSWGLGRGEGSSSVGTS